jgi:hypothetical protein
LYEIAIIQIFHFSSSPGPMIRSSLSRTAAITIDDHTAFRWNSPLSFFRHQTADGVHSAAIPVLDLGTPSGRNGPSGLSLFPFYFLPAALNTAPANFSLEHTKTRAERKN